VLAHGQWFSPASSNTITGRHNIHVVEILLKVPLKHNKSNQKIKLFQCLLEIYNVTMISENILMLIGNILMH
jgi:hypothetical protein